jgi:hypothetical protein
MVGRWDGTEYLRKHQLSPLQIHSNPDPRLGLVVTIPAHDEPDLLRTLQSLTACSRGTQAVEIIVGLNIPEGSTSDLRARHVRYLAEASRFAAQRLAPGYRIHVLDYPSLPKRHAGVGLARKLIMDEAVARLCKAANPEGIIACLDADCTVEPGYLQRLLEHFQVHRKSPACSIYYEHPLDEHDDAPLLRAGIVRYELYLRYHVHALRYAGFPHAFQTVGSSMAVRCNVYQREGGMNRRQGGEDFYFLSKIIPLGEFSEVCSTTVYPSPRVSHRVPFGTGRAMGDWIAGEKSTWWVYPLAVFDTVRALFARAAELWRAPLSQAAAIDWISPDLAHFLDHNGFCERVEQMRMNAASPASFEKHFLQWFNGFRVLKYLHWLGERGQTQTPVEAAAADLLRRAGLLESACTVDAESLLQRFRRLDRDGERLRFH